MTVSSRGFSLNEVDALIKGSRNAQNLLRKELVSSYEEFVDVLYDEMDIVINALESNPQHYYHDDEDKITHAIVSMLQMRNYNASQGTTSGGNVDITVNGPDAAWDWIGEAKIYKSLADLREGFLQLTTRYRNASPNYSCRGILAYTKRSDAAGHLATWNVEVSGMGLDEYDISACSKRGSLAFHTTHKDKSSGLPVKIRHNAVCLHHFPMDKSARGASKYKGRTDE
jgi:hypothetical protein